MRRITYLNRATRRCRGASLALWKVVDEEGVRCRLSDAYGVQCRLCGVGAQSHPCDELQDQCHPSYEREVQSRLCGDGGAIEEQIAAALNTPVSATSQSPKRLLDDPVSSLSVHPATSHDQAEVKESYPAELGAPTEGSQSGSYADPH